MDTKNGRQDQIFQVLQIVDRRIDELDRWVRLLFFTQIVTVGLVFFVAAYRG
jgi:hypothetical protein